MLLRDGPVFDLDRGGQRPRLRRYRRRTEPGRWATPSGRRKISGKASHVRGGNNDKIQVSRLGDARIGRRGIEHFRHCPNPQANPLPQGQFDERDKQSSRTAAQVDPVPRFQPTRCLQAGRRGTIADAESTRAVSMHDAKGAEPMSTLKLFAACHPREPRRNACVGAGGGLRTRLLRTILSYCELQQRRSG